MEAAEMSRRRKIGTSYPYIWESGAGVYRDENPDGG
jgi:hypothetical protein